MIRLDHLQKLENIAKKYEIIIMDTSIFMNYYKIKGEGTIGEFDEFRKFIMDSIKYAPLFITQFVEKECSRGFGPYKRRIKMKGANIKKCREINKLRKKYLELTNCFKSHKRILYFDCEKPQQYNAIYEQYCHFSPNLGITDLEIAISGVIASQEIGKCAIFSNDQKILHLLQFYAQKGENKDIVDATKRLCFFIRADGNRFKQIPIYKKTPNHKRHKI